MSKEDEKEKVEVVQKKKLGTINQILEAHEYVFNKQVNGEIDSKGAETLNKTLHGTIALQKLKLAAADLYLQSKLKKINIPDNMMIEFIEGTEKRKEPKDSIEE